MAPPTRPQIEAAQTKPTYAAEVDTGSGYTAVPAQYVLDVSGAVEAAGGDSGMNFGAEATATATVVLDPAAGLAWDGAKIRIKYGFDTSDTLARVAGIVIAEDAQDDGPITWTVAGWDEPIARTPVYSPLFFRRAASTATSVSSVEDPTNGAYAAGLVNYICWTAGGRPYEQAGSYPTATFYYSCDTSLIVPEWSWCAGENAWEELGRIARACGLVIYQDADGVLRCRHALNLAGSGSYTFTSAVFKRARRSAARGEKIASARCSYTARALQPRAIVYEDTTPRFVLPASTTTFTLEFRQPVYDVEASGSTLPADSIAAITTEGLAVSVTPTIVSLAAGRIQIQVGNAGNDVLIISRVQIRGRALAPVEDGIVTVGSGTPERELGSDTGVYVQSRRHAERIAKLYVDFYGTPRPTYELSECGYDPDRFVGEAVLFTYAPWGLTNAPCRITAIRHSNTGATMDVSLVPTSGIPTLADVFVWGQTYADGVTKTLSY